MEINPKIRSQVRGEFTELIHSLVFVGIPQSLFSIILEI